MEGSRAAGRLPRVRTRRRRRLRSHRLVAASALVVLLLGSAGASIAYIGLKPGADKLQAALTAQLQAGQRDLEAGKNALVQANSKHDNALITQAGADFVSARSDFLAATQLANDSRLLRYLEFTPALGGFARSRHAAVDSIAQAGVGVSDAGQALTSLYAHLTNAASGSRNVLPVLDEIQTAMTTVRSDLERAQAAARQV